MKLEVLYAEIISESFLCLPKRTTFLEHYEVVNILVFLAGPEAMKPNLSCFANTDR
jgi:hypothetical protein